MTPIKKLSFLLLFGLFTISMKASVDSTNLVTSGNSICYDSCKGYAIIEVFSTSPGPFRILWRGNNLPSQLVVDTTNSTDTLFNLCVGSYTVEVIDLNDNSKLFPQNFTISQPQTMSANYSFQRPTCLDSTNGIINATITNASVPIHYQWSSGPNDTNSSVTGLVAGKYELSVTDSNGCILIDTFYLANYDTLKANISGLGVSCKGLCDGSVMVAPTGGVGPIPGYSISWSNSDTNLAISNLCPGNFIATVTDFNGCQTIDSFLVEEPDSLLASYDLVETNCNGDCNGEATAIVTGGTRPYNYHWSSYVSQDSILTNACAGLITSTITDANGCFIAKNININEPQPIKIQPTITASTCNVCDGQISVNVTGGSGSYHYLWIGQKAEDTVPSIDSLCAGIYQLAITDDSLCTDTFNIILSDDTSGIKDIGFNFSKTSCENICDGSIIAQVFGGSSPYTYSWSPGLQTDSVISGLCAGRYTVEIEDATGCKRIEEIHLGSESNLSAQINESFNGCNGSCEGDISLNLTGGIGPYIVNWVGSTSQGTEASNLCPGSYPFRVTDANSCIYLDTAAIGEPNALSIAFTVTNTNCYQSCDGSVIAAVTGGQAPYTIVWSNGLTGNSISNLCMGSYWAEVTDATGCTKRMAFNMSQPSEIQLNATLYHPDCGLSNGAIVINPSGGQPPYTHSFIVNGDSLSRLAASTNAPYIISTTDSKGCVGRDSFILENKNGPDFSYQITNETCPGACDGIIALSAPGVKGPVDYIFMPSQGTSTTATNAGLCPGTYYVGIEAEGCRSIEEVKIKKAREIKVAFDISQASCENTCDASISAHITGGYAPYTVNWSTGSSLNTISGLCPGTYTLTVSDTNGCVFTEDILISNPQGISINLSTSNLSCYNVCDGSIMASVTGGSGNYSYLWSNGGNAQMASNLCAGMYSVTVTDENGCIGTENISIGNGIPITTSFLAVGASCGSCDGSLTATVNGGNGIPYSYMWSTGDTTNTAGDLTAGIYTLEVTDNSGCSQEFKTMVNNVGGPVTSDTSFSASCFGSCDGSAKANTNPVSNLNLFQWFDPQMQTGDSIGSLCEGLYYYSVRDSNDCLSYDSVTVNQPSEIILAAQTTTIVCPSDSNGSIQLQVSGGVAPYTYLWSNSDTTDFTDSLYQGTYSVIVSDTAGCQQFDTITISDPVQLSIQFDVSNSLCFNACDGVVKASVIGGSGPYSYTWNDPLNQTTNTAAGLCVGYVSLTVTDAKGCAFTDSALVNSPALISATPTTSNPTCKNGDNGSIGLVINGGTAPYQVFWSNGMTGQTINGLSNGSFTANIFDANQCQFQATYILNNPSTPLNVNVNVTKPACGNNNGSLTAAASGGTGNYSFTWNTIPTKTTSTITNIWAGIYEVTVTDNIAGCIEKKIVIVENTGAQNLNLSHIDESCDTMCNGRAAVIGATATSIYSWNDPFNTTDSVAFNLCSGLYTVMTTDTSNNCVSFDTVSIGTSDLDLSVLEVKRASCFSSCDGSATVQGIGLNQPFTYSWNTSPSQSTQTATNLCGNPPFTSYRATVTDTTGCTKSANIRIVRPDSIIIDIDVLNNVTCSATCTGTANANISGGTKPYKYIWNGVLGGSINSTLCSGNNTLEIRDASNCSSVINFVIEDATPILANVVIIEPACQEYNGSITLNPSGGTGPYYYKWSNGKRTSEIKNLFAGIYSVDITDAKGCVKTFTYFLNNPNSAQLVFENNTVKCNGDCNGVARVSPVGGVGPYTFQWNHAPASTKDSLTELCSGIYFVRVTSANGCISFGADTISEPSILTASLTKISDGCGGSCEGEANLTVNGGTLPYEYSWNTSPPQTAPSAVDLCAGFASVLLTDANGCQLKDSVEIIPPNELVIDSITTVNASCFTNEDGEAMVFFSGGTAPVQILWKDGQKVQHAIDLGSGKLYVQITDTNGCITSDTSVIAVDDTVLVTAFVDSLVCIGNRALLQGTGQGVSTYQWFSDSSGTLKSIGSGDSIYYLVEDTVTIYLRGQNSVSPPCFDLDTGYIVGIPSPEIVASAGTTLLEEGQSTELLASPFLFNGSYAWSPSESLNDSASIAPLATPEITTTYVVIGINEFGCVGSDSIIINVVKDESIINGFSPNGDGVNDKWIIPSLDGYPDVIVEVYNRWGIQVFKSVGYKDPWDGSFEGTILPNASYYFVIDYYGDGEKVETGAVTILY